MRWTLQRNGTMKDWQLLLNKDNGVQIVDRYAAELQLQWTFLRHRMYFNRHKTLSHLWHPGR